MRNRIRRLLSSHHAAGFALLAAVLLGACATGNPETARTRSLLSAAGFHTVKPETPEQRGIYSQMPENALEGGIIQGKQIYSYKDSGKGVVYVGGETEFQQYERLLAESKKTGQSDPAQKMNPHRAMVGQQSFGYRGLWLGQYLNE